jgi:hypothetical protein
MTRMQPALDERNFKALLWPVFLVIAYRLWFVFRPALTGSNQIDGLLGVTLGLYTCARAVANLLDLLFRYRKALDQILVGWHNRLWIAMNLLTLAFGFGAVFFALTRFFR